MKAAIVLGIALSFIACNSTAPSPDAGAPDSSTTLDAAPSCSSLTCDHVCRDPFVPRDVCVVGSTWTACELGALPDAGLCN